MEQVPKIVVERLRAGAKPEVHPDPDLLTAFAENAIAERERTSVMEHLAQCADCRELLLLAQPELEVQRLAVAAAAMAAPIPARATWLRGPMFRWAALAACVVVVAGGTFLLRHQSPAERQDLASVRELKEKEVKDKEPKETETGSYDAKLEVPERNDHSAVVPAGVPPQPAPQSTAVAPPPPPPLAKVRSLDEMAENGSPAGKKSSAEPGQAEPRDKGSLMGGSAAKVSEPMMRQKEEALKADRARTTTSMEARNLEPASPAAPPAQVLAQRDNRKSEVQAKQATAALSQADQIQAKQAQANQANANQANANQIQVTQDQANEAQGQLSTETVEVSKAKAKDAAPAATPRAAVHSGSFGASHPQAIGGMLADKNEPPLREAGAALMPRWTLSSDGTTLLRSLDSGKTWQSVPVGNKAILRAVAALDAEVWVGGAGGALFHSSDMGNHWKQVEPTADGGILNADIAAIDFTDGQHGKVTTATHEVWITNDAGQSWRKQPISR